MARLNQLFIPGEVDNPQFFHAYSSDKISACTADIGWGYIQVIQLQDDLSLEIPDYTFDLVGIFKLDIAILFPTIELMI